MSPDLIEMRLAELSERIRQGREKGGLTLNQLSARSGVAPSTIQKIESRQMVPSIAVILKIALGLGVEPGELIAPRDPLKLDIVIQRVGQHPRMTVSENMIYEKLSADIRGSELECWRIVLAPHYETRLSRPQTFSEQIIYCERGKIELDLDRQLYELSAGDTLHCISKVFYGIRNRGRSESAYITAGRFPHSLRAGR